jgi:hypothetical protein
VNWIPAARAAAATLEAIAGAFGPLPLAVARFAGAVTVRAIQLAEEKADPVRAAEELGDQAIDFVQRLKLDALAREKAGP